MDGKECLGQPTMSSAYRALGLSFPFLIPLAPLGYAASTPPHPGPTSARPPVYNSHRELETGALNEVPRPPSTPPDFHAVLTRLFSSTSALRSARVHGPAHSPGQVLVGRAHPALHVRFFDPCRHHIVHEAHRARGLLPNPTRCSVPRLLERPSRAPGEQSARALSPILQPNHPLPLLARTVGRDPRALMGTRAQRHRHLGASGSCFNLSVRRLPFCAVPC